METFSALLAFCEGDSPVNGEFPSQRPVTRGLFSLICARTNGWANRRDAGDLGRHRALQDVTAMLWGIMQFLTKQDNQLSMKPVNTES